MNVWTMDLGTKTGYAIHVGDGLKDSGAQDWKTKRHEGGGMRFLRFERWLDGLLKAHGKPRALYYEEVRAHNGVTAAHTYGGFEATLTKWCDQHGIPYSSVPIGTWKKAATGNGAAGKKKIIAEMFKYWGVMPEDDNHADALGIMLYVLDNLC